jgi:hypothetical protein
MQAVSMREMPLALETYCLCLWRKELEGEVIGVRRQCRDLVGDFLHDLRGPASDLECWYEQLVGRRPWGGCSISATARDSK